MDIVLIDYFHGLGFLAWLNIKHYSRALFGVGLRLDPDYPAEARFHGDLIVDAVLEYRGYALFAPWCVFLAAVLPWQAVVVIGALWAVLAWKRAFYYSSPFEFWTRAYNEAPNKHRNRIRYFEELTNEIQRLDKTQIPWSSPEIQRLVQRSREIQELIVRGNWTP